MSFLSHKGHKEHRAFLCHALFVPFVFFVANPYAYQNLHHAFFTGSIPPVSL